MVNILIIGATGYVGHALSQSLVRSGNHRVYGLARSPEKAASLARDEVLPILSSITSAALAEAINEHRIDIVVDVSGANQDSYTLLTLVQKVGAERLAAAKKEGIRIQRLGFIYCSGTWVHGSSNSPINDLVPVGTASAPFPATELTAWRPELERAVLASSDVLDVVVVRPALVYGRSSAIWTSLFEPLYAAAQNSKVNGGKEVEGVVKVPVEEESRPGLVHVDDVASGFHCAIEKLSLIAGTGVYPVFDLQTSQESMRDILTSAAKEFEWKGKVELVGAGEDLFMRAMSVSGNGCSGRAKTVLGWEPRRYGFVSGMDVFAKAWVASRS
jgi:nucleoside-diphosphate-sugar epimerase